MYVYFGTRRHPCPWLDTPGSNCYSVIWKEICKIFLKDETEFPLFVPYFSWVPPGSFITKKVSLQVYQMQWQWKYLMSEFLS
jgi:hypothetical protein